MAISVFFPLYPPDDPSGQWKEAEFQFGSRAAYDMERINGCTHTALLERGQVLMAVIGMLEASLKHGDRSMTRDKALDLYEKFVDHGGDPVDLYNALDKAVGQSGVYRKRKIDEPVKEGSEDPRMASATVM